MHRGRVPRHNKIALRRRSAKKSEIVRAQPRSIERGAHSKRAHLCIRMGNAPIRRHRVVPAFNAIPTQRLLAEQTVASGNASEVILHLIVADWRAWKKRGDAGDVPVPESAHGPELTTERGAHEPI